MYLDSRDQLYEFYQSVDYLLSKPSTFIREPSSLKDRPQFPQLDGTFGYVFANLYNFTDSIATNDGTRFAGKRCVFPICRILTEHSGLEVYQVLLRSSLKRILG